MDGSINSLSFLLIYLKHVYFKQHNFESLELAQTFMKSHWKAKNPFAIIMKFKIMVLSMVDELQSYFLKYIIIINSYYYWFVKLLVAVILLQQWACVVLEVCLCSLHLVKSLHYWLFNLKSNKGRLHRERRLLWATDWKWENFIGFWFIQKYCNTVP